MPKAIRDIYGQTLLELGETNPDIVVLDADLSSSTKTAAFGKAYPDRFFNMGIAEANMVSTAAGMASAGKIPFANTFTCFLTTLGLIAIKSLICYSNLNVKLGGAYCGMSDALDGSSHHALEDISFMRALPNMTVLCPSDEHSARSMTKWAAEYNGPVYLRLSREVYPDLYSEDLIFEPGKGRIVREGSDCTVIACGILVHKAMEAAERLKEEGISVQVVDIMSIKPIDSALIEACIRKTGALVTAEEHNIIGGLGAAVAETMAKLDVSAPMEFVGTKDTFTESGNYNLLLKKYGLDAEGVITGIRAVLNRKR